MIKNGRCDETFVIFEEFDIILLTRWRGGGLGGGGGLVGGGAGESDFFTMNPNLK